MKHRIILLLCSAALLMTGCSNESSIIPDEPLQTDTETAPQTEAVTRDDASSADESSADPVLLHEEKNSEIPAEAVTLRTGVTISGGETVEIAKDYLNDHGDPVLVLVSLSDGNYMPLTNAEYKYDNAGRMIWKHENTITNDYINYSYDANGRLVTEDFYASDFHPHRIEYSYDQYGNLLRKVTTYTEQDTVFNMMPLTDDYSDMELDNAGRIVKQREMSAAGTTANYEITFTYDDAGNCVREEKTALNENMDPASVITTRSFDENSNMTSEIIKQIMSNGTEHTLTKTMQYDSEGRMTYQKSDVQGEIVEVQYTYEPI
ncbi:MAG: hypothetical protein MJ065_09225 [Oscillospiraceae bacterium]|nr:hypothetical protein [Oscillospiraceae bacterium]